MNFGKKSFKKGIIKIKKAFKKIGKILIVLTSFYIFISIIFCWISFLGVEIKKNALILEIVNIFKNLSFFKVLQEVSKASGFFGVISREIIPTLMNGYFLKGGLLIFINNLMVALYMTATSVVIYPAFLLFFINGWGLGIALYQTSTQQALLNPLWIVVIFEFGAYLIACSLGINIGLSFIWPSGYSVSSRKKALILAFKDTAWLYLVVILSLVIAAVVESFMFINMVENIS